jgi:hypothetical protein
MADVFHKTTLGYEEMSTRAHGLSPRLRRVLILIDGKRSMKELIDMLVGEDVSALAQTLELQGFIELVGLSSPVSGTQMKALTPTVMGLNTTVQPSRFDKLFTDTQPLYMDSSGQMRRPLTLAERKTRATRVIDELLGPSAEGIALKIEATKDSESLEKALHMAMLFIGEAVNPVAAKRFKDHVRLADGA